MRILFLALFYVGLAVSTFAQQDAQFSYYMFNSLYYNPAFAGAENVTKISLLHRSQWAFYQSDFNDGSAPMSQVFSLSSPIFKIRGGFGGHIVHDQLGAQNNLEVQGSFAYHLGIKQSKISIGVRAGFFSQSLDWDMYRYIDPNDEVLAGQTGRESQVRPDMAAGIFFLNEKYYAGVSFNHLLRSTFDFGIAELRNSLTNHMYITAGHYYNISNAARLHSSALLQTDFNQYNVTLGLIMTVMDRNLEKMWIGTTLRQSEDVGLLLGYHFLKDKSLRAGYSFGYVIKDQNAKKPTSHEFMLIYELPAVGTPDKKQQQTPRFRH
ncbi:MAG: type IX secretion system membrane protein PorP/SprF [Cyclobacteriaceae bacterium]|nr:type IX secretion system membrane protein PorP/SprF [Cyclobacteriaceae bacterium]